MKLITFESMMSSFFKSPKSKKFHFQARYYDQNKEELEERYERIKAEIAGEKRSGSSIKTGDLKSQWLQSKKTSHFEKKSNIRLVVIAALLSGLCYYILYL